MRSKVVKLVDLALSRLPGAVAPGLVVLGFHGVWRDMAVAGQGVVDPYQPLTLADLDQLIDELKRMGLGFVTARDGARQGPVVWLTFDDGYANNLAVLPILRRHGVPATFFITSGNVLSGEAFWWDVLHREGTRRGQAPSALATWRETLKALPPEGIRQALIAAFGETIFRPVSDDDRPMTPQELSAFAADPLVEIGNHTQNHAILPVLDAAGQRAEIAAAQDGLAKLTGARPKVIAYPNGGATAQTAAIAASLGLQTGVTCLPHRNQLQDMDSAAARLSIGRFMGARHGVLAREMRLALAPAGVAQRRATTQRRALFNL